MALDMAWCSWIPERMDEHLRFAALRRRAWPTVDMTSLPVEQVVMQVAALVKTATSTWPAVCHSRVTYNARLLRAASPGPPRRTAAASSNAADHSFRGGIAARLKCMC